MTTSGGGLNGGVRWRRAAPMLALAVVGPILLDASAVVVAKGIGWGALVLPSMFLLPLAALLVLVAEPASWWKSGFCFGFFAGGLGGGFLGLRWPPLEPFFVVLPALALGAAVGWIMDLADQDWMRPPGDGRRLRPGPAPLRRPGGTRPRTAGTGVPPVG